MQALFDYIISTENRYNNVVDVDDKKLVVNTEITERDYMFVNRIGKVISVPAGIKTEVSVGDEIIVHHNVFRRWYDMKGREKKELKKRLVRKSKRLKSIGPKTSLKKLKMMQRP